ncbi:MAG TPA: hypothetical protein VFW74_08865 [Acidimicrobiia bacterium]|nr:hypothetical protein [Acidimicrobiia bacterium]
MEGSQQRTRARSADELAPLAVVDMLGAAIGCQRRGRAVDVDAIRQRIDASRARLREAARADGREARRCAVLLATWQQLEGVLEALAVGDTDLADVRFRAAIDFPLESVVGGTDTEPRASRGQHDVG